MVCCGARRKMPCLCRLSRGRFIWIWPNKQRESGACRRHLGTFIPVSTKYKGSIMVATVTTEQTIQAWGNGLGVRITAPVAKAARFARGLPIKVEVVEGGVFLRAVGKPQLTLAQKLKAFDPAIHGGEVMATGRIGAEVF